MSQNIWIFIVILIVVSGIALLIMSSKNKCKYYKENGKCVDKCVNKIWDFTTKSCVASCPTGTFEKQINIQNEVWKICTECPEGKVPYKGTCVDEEKCLSDGKKLRFTRYGITCVDSCDSKNDDEKDDDSCFEKSPNPCGSSGGLINPITRECCNDKNSFGEYIYIQDKRGNNLGLPTCQI